MAFWTWTHNILGLHVYVIPTLAVVVLMIILGVAHGIKQHNRRKKYEKQIDKINEMPGESEGFTGALDTLEVTERSVQI